MYRIGSRLYCRCFDTNAGGSRHRTASQRITVVGGAYREICLRPPRDVFYGSGVTGAIVLASFNSAIRLATTVDKEREADLRFNLKSYHIEADIHRAAQTIAFRYTTPLAVPQIFPRLDAVESVDMTVAGDNVVMYGMLEAQPRVKASACVYDPQSGWRPRRFRRDLAGTADRLAYVLNHEEIQLLTGLPDVVQAARALMAEERADIVIVKGGLSGASVVDREHVHQVPAYRANSGPHLIGSGDVFTAVFAHHWFRGISPTEAADRASRSIAAYITTGNPDVGREEPNVQAIAAWSGSAYIAAPFFTATERWLVDELRSYLRQLHIRPHSPLHEVGLGSPAVIAPADLALLERSDRVLAILDGRDPGTLFEVGYAKKCGVPVWAVSTSNREAEFEKGDLRMLLGSGVRLFKDLTEAIVDIATV